MKPVKNKRSASRNIRRNIPKTAPRDSLPHDVAHEQQGNKQFRRGADPNKMVQFKVGRDHEPFVLSASSLREVSPFFSEIVSNENEFEYNNPIKICRRFVNGGSFVLLQNTSPKVFAIIKHIVEELKVPQAEFDGGHSTTLDKVELLGKAYILSIDLGLKISEIIFFALTWHRLGYGKPITDGYAHPEVLYKMTVLFSNLYEETHRMTCKGGPIRGFLVDWYSWTIDREHLYDMLDMVDIDTEFVADLEEAYYVLMEKYFYNPFYHRNIVMGSGLEHGASGEGIKQIE